MAETVEADVTHKEHNKFGEPAGGVKSAFKASIANEETSDNGEETISTKRDTFGCETVANLPVNKHSVMNESGNEALQVPSRSDQQEVRQIEEKPYECSTCLRRFSSKNGIQYHQHTHTGHKPSYKCDQCPKSFATSGRLAAHKRLHTGDLAFICDVCGKAFSIISQLKRHETMHSQDLPFECSVCGRFFKTKNSRKYHELSHNDVTQEKPHECTTCKKHFSSKSYLKYHQSVHTGDRVFKCDECPKAFIVSTALAAHKLTHSGELPFGCDVCGRAFSKNSQLKAHEAAHSQELPFGCSVCGKLFKTKHQLKYHEANHTDTPKMFKCEKCEHSFHFLWQLTKHQKSHERKYNKCKLCRKTFVTIENLEKHEKNVHAPSINCESDHSDSTVGETQVSVANSVNCERKTGHKKLSKLVPIVQIKEESGNFGENLCDQSKQWMTSQMPVEGRFSSNCNDSAFEFVSVFSGELVCDKGGASFQTEKLVRVKQENSCEAM